MRRLALLAASGSVLLAAPPAAVAAEAGSYRFAVTPVAGYRMGGEVDGSGEDGGRPARLDDAAMAGFILNVPVESLGGDAYTEMELYVARQSVGLDEAPAGVDPALEADITHVLIGGTYVGGGGAVRPFLAAGIGAAHLDPDAAGYDSDTVFGFGIGVGAQFFPASRIGLRLEARALGSVIDNDSALLCESDSGGAECAFRANGDVLLQWEVFAGLTARF